MTAGLAARPAFAALALLAMLLAGCAQASSSQPPGQRLSVWAAQNDLSGTLSDISADLAQIDTDRRAGHPGLVQLDCVGLRNDIDQANSELLPDVPLVDGFVTAYKDYYGFASTCALDRGQIDSQAAALRAQGQRTLASVLAQYKALVGKAAD